MTFSRGHVRKRLLTGSGGVRSGPALLVSACVLLAPSAWAISVNTTSTSAAQINTTNTTTVTQQVNTFQTELKARMQGGTFLYDQTFNVAFSDPSIATAIAQAKTVLTGAGAASFSGPTQLSSNQSTSSSVNTTSTTTNQTPTISVTTYIGPITLMIGNFGVCTGNGPTGFTGCTGGTASTISVVPGGQDIDTLVVLPVTINQTVTTTNTTLTSQVYEIDGFLAGVTPPPVTPAPPALLLILTGLAGAGLFAALRKRRSGFTSV